MKFEKKSVIFGSLWAVSLLMGWRPLFETLALSVHNDEYTHILLILPISASLIYLERRRLQQPERWEFFFAAIILAIASIPACCSLLFPVAFAGDVALAMEMLTLVLSWIGIFALCFGRKGLSAALFPLLFLLGLVPVPQRVLDLIITQLQLGSAWSAHALFVLCRVPVVQHGVFLTIPGLTVEVAQECSSIRSSSMLLVTTIVLTQILLRSAWPKVLVISLAIPLSVAKNGLRIFTIAMLGTKVDPGYLTGRLHHEGGILFFLIALLGIFAVLAICQRAEGASLKAS